MGVSAGILGAEMKAGNKQPASVVVVADDDIQRGGYFELEVGEMLQAVAAEC